MSVFVLQWSLFRIDQGCIQGACDILQSPDPKLNLGWRLQVNPLADDVGCKFLWRNPGGTRLLALLLTIGNQETTHGGWETDFLPRETKYSGTPSWPHTISAMLLIEKEYLNSFIQQRGNWYGYINLCVDGWVYGHNGWVVGWVNGLTSMMHEYYDVKTNSFWQNIFRRWSNINVLLGRL